MLRRADLGGAVLDDARLDGADLRGAVLPEGMTAKALRGALTGAVPEPLSHGSNRLWPMGLTARINEILAGCDDSTLFAVARDARAEGKAALAEHLFRVLVDWRQESLGPEHSDTLSARHNLARAVKDQGRASEAEEMIRALLSLREKVEGVERVYTLKTRHELASTIQDQGRVAEAEEMFRALLPVREKVQGAEHVDTLVTYHQLARAVLNQARASEAEGMFRTCLVAFEKLDREDHWSAMAIKRWLALALLEQGKEAEAMTLGLSPGGDGPFPKHKCRAHLVRAFLADLEGDAALAEAHLNAAEEVMAGMSPDHEALRALACYRRTRTPGGAGGTTLWMIADADSERSRAAT